MSALPIRPAMPEHSTDATGVITGNTDITGSSQWQPPQGEPDRAPLPGEEHLIDNPKSLPWLTEGRAYALSAVCAALASGYRFGWIERPAVAVAVLALAVAVLALLPILRDMRDAMRIKRREEVRAAQNAALADAILDFDDPNTYASRIHGRMYADGILPDRRRTRR